jgi:hypothetical protein
MIADLKADSSRWDDERRATSSRGQPANGIRDSSGNFRQSNTPVVGYRDSTTHQSRQYYGPTEAAAATPTGGYPPSSAAGGAQQQQEVYAQGYGAGQNYGQPNPGYGAPGPGYGGPNQPDNYAYIAGADYQPAVDPGLRGGRNGPLPPAQVPRGAAGYPPQPPTSYPEGRGNPGGYYAPPNSHGPASSQYPAHPGEPGYYGRQSTYNTDCIFLPSSPRRKETL